MRGVGKGGQDLQEVDYYLNWSYDIEPIVTTSTLGWTFYAFPNAKDVNTSEWSLGNPEDKGLIQDEFFGGMSLGWSF